MQPLSSGALGWVPQTSEVALVSIATLPPQRWEEGGTSEEAAPTHPVPVPESPAHPPCPHGNPRVGQWTRPCLGTGVLTHPGTADPRVSHRGPRSLSGPGPHSAVQTPGLGPPLVALGPAQAVNTGMPLCRARGGYLAGGAGRASASGVPGSPVSSSGHVQLPAPSLHHPCLLLQPHPQNPNDTGPLLPLSCWEGQKAEKGGGGERDRPCLSLPLLK